MFLQLLISLISISIHYYNKQKANYYANRIYISFITNSDFFIVTLLSNFEIEHFAKLFVQQMSAGVLRTNCKKTALTVTGKEKKCSIVINK